MKYFRNWNNCASEREISLMNTQKTIHTPISPLNKTIYEINGSLANLQEYDDIIFNISGSENVNSA
jgi:hypothetical protein